MFNTAFAKIFVYWNNMQVITATSVMAMNISIKINENCKIENMA